LAPLGLCIAYVLLPYWLGVVVAGQTLTAGDALLLAAFMVLFLGCINLKDFRDRAGDARYGKPTFVLRYGKRAAWLVSITAAAGREPAFGRCALRGLVGDRGGRSTDGRRTRCAADVGAGRN
jgi:hypothetical protein